ncbi:MAG: hypothetical protein CSA33_00975 [Desulfobulbus propionicus]|nr:MAG: hypothetical protein CSA33_00975 [Desulfobulbus propionicus]
MNSEYDIPDTVRRISELAGPMMIKLFGKLLWQPEAYQYRVSDINLTASVTLNNLESELVDVVDIINRLAESFLPEDVDIIFPDLEMSLNNIIENIDDIKTADFSGQEDGKMLLIALLSRPLLDIIHFFQKLSYSVSHPMEFADADNRIDLSLVLNIEEEADAWRIWTEKQGDSFAGYGSISSRNREAELLREKNRQLGKIAAAFGLGWWFGSS